jgi:hypothetical protein
MNVEYTPRLQDLGSTVQEFEFERHAPRLRIRGSGIGFRVDGAKNTVDGFRLTVKSNGVEFDI